MEAVDIFGNELKEGDHVAYVSPYRGSHFIFGIVKRITKKTVMIGNYRRTNYPKTDLYKLLPEQIEILKSKGKI